LKHIPWKTVMIAAAVLAAFVTLGPLKKFVRDSLAKP